MMIVNLQLVALIPLLRITVTINVLNSTAILPLDLITLMLSAKIMMPAQPKFANVNLDANTKRWTAMIITSVPMIAAILT
jgi:hypothetical protein